MTEAEIAIVEAAIQAELDRDFRAWKKPTPAPGASARMRLRRRRKSGTPRRVGSPSRRSRPWTLAGRDSHRSAYGYDA